MEPSRHYETGPDATGRATDEALRRAHDASSIICVEGISDQIALETMADRIGRDLLRDRVVVVPIGGAHAIANLVAELGDRGDLRISGLVDEAEADLFVRAAANAPGFSPERIHICVRDLEEELIRSLDPPALEALLEADGDLGSFRTMQKQPAWRGHPFEAQIHRWMRSISGRSNRYADRILRSADSQLPAPLVAAIETA